MFIYCRHMETTDWIAGLPATTTREIAKRSGISERTLQHQVTTGRVTMENIAKIAIAYSIHPLRALIDTDYIDEAWSQVPDVTAALRLASNDQLADEILRRLNAAGDAGIEEPAVFTEPVDDLAARRTHGRLSDVPDRFAASDRDHDSKIPDSHDLGEESQDPDQH
ncbi:HTH DNA binding protein [Gordonia phage GMA4]|uniref:HTH DNA binding protein n=1 Tax=Gordonia phage GMA4 TaxID=1647471 RepID=UPI0006BCED35|nr:HTH DNA binding protein [Gordonia phage GMA4]AKJ72307.1 hypothetical protein GMA4_32 [Gordonia phage GMA4]